MKYRLRWREVGGSWTQKLKDANWTYHWLTGLTAGTTYEWQMKVACVGSTGNGGQWTAVKTFSTPSAKFELGGAAGGYETGAFRLFPNPASDQATLILPAAEACQIRVMSISGAVVLMENHAASNQIALDLSALNRGVYVLEARTQHGAQHLRLVVQ